MSPSAIRDDAAPRNGDGDPSWPAARRAALLALVIAVGYFPLAGALFGLCQWGDAAAAYLIDWHRWLYIPQGLIAAVLVAFLMSRRRIFLAFAEPCFAAAYLSASAGVPYGWVVFLDLQIRSPVPVWEREEELYASLWRLGIAGLAGYLAAIATTQFLVRRASTSAREPRRHCPEPRRPRAWVRLGRWLGRRTSRRWHGLVAFAVAAALPVVAVIVNFAVIKAASEPNLDVSGEFLRIFSGVSWVDHVWGFMFVDPFVASGWWFSIAYLLAQMYAVLLLALAAHVATRSTAALHFAELIIVGMYVLFGAVLDRFGIEVLFVRPEYGYDLSHHILLFPIVAAAIVLPIGHYVTRRAATVRH